MLTIIAAAALLAAQPIAEVPHLVRFATAVQAQDNAKELMAIAWVETKYRNELVSVAGACCYMQVKPQEEDPPCDVLQREPWVCVLAAQRRVDEYKRHCGDDWLNAYNGGFDYCCDGSYYRRNRERKKDEWKCGQNDGYKYAVKQKMRGME